MVRIVDDFWTNYAEYEEVIKSSILHLVRTQFPDKDPQGEEAAMNFVILELHRLSIFSKWQEERLKDKKRPTEKLFENFLYQRIWSILRNEYSRRRKRSLRFKRMAGVGDFRKECYTTPDRLYDDEPKIEEIQDTRRKNRGARDRNGETVQEREARLRHKRAGEQPTIHDAGEITGNYSLSEIDENFREETLRDMILSVCRTDRERKIVELREEGLQMNEVGAALGMSGSNVGAILGRIRDRLPDMETA